VSERTQSEVFDLQGIEPRKFELFRIYNKRRDNKKPFVDNKIHTARYNVVTFLPKNLFYQFSKMTNLYFLVLTILDWYIHQRLPAMVFPLGFVISVSMIKDIFEDMKRHESDKRENRKKVLVGDIASGEF
jgi:Phospholipid-translocating ATPase N-terminal